MKRPTAFLPIHFCILLTLAPGICGLAPRAGAEDGPFLLVEPVERAEKAAPAPSVWVEAVFVEAGEAAVRELEGGLGFRLSPWGGKVILNGEEKEKLLALIQESEGASIISSLTVVTTSGQESQSEDVEQVIFPTEYDTETINVGSGREATTNLIPGEVFMVTPGNWEVRDVGTILNVTPTVSRDGKTITLALMPEITQLADWVNYGNEIYPIFQPIFRTWSKAATITIPNGASFVFKEMPRKAFEPERRESRGSFGPEKKTRRVAEATKEAESRLREDARQPDLKSLPQSLERRQAQLREELQESVEKLSRMKKKFVLDRRDQPIQYQRREQHMLERGLVRAQAAKLKAYVDLLDGMSIEERVNATQDKPGVYQLSSEIARQEAELSGLLEKYGGEHPVIKAQKRSIAKLKERLHGLVNGALEAKKVELAALKEQEKHLDKIIKSLDQDILEVERQLPQFEALKREVELRQAALLKLEEEASLPVKEWTRKVKSEGAAEKASPQEEEILKKLNTIIPEVKFQDASLKNVVDFFARVCDVNIVIDAAVFQPPYREAAKESGITVSLKNVLLKEALKYILRYRNLKYLVEDHAIAIVPVDFVPPESLETEIFRFPSLADPSGDEGEPRIGETFVDFLRQSGIPWPEGSNITFDAKTGTLVVTNTPGNLALVRQFVSFSTAPEPEKKDREKRTILLTIISAKVVE